MLDHITLRVTNIKKSKDFFLKALRPLGYKIVEEATNEFGFGQSGVHGERDFWIKESKLKIDVHSFSCLAFKASNKKIVDQFHEAALKAGGKDNGPPGYRKKYHPGYYAAFVLDPDGHNVEAVFDDFSYLSN